MSHFLALGSAVLFGLGDFTGGFTTKRLSVWVVMFWSQLIGVAVLAVGFLVVPVYEVAGADIGYGALGGTFGLIGLVIFYAALARGTMSVIAPITGATTALLPVLFDLATGGTLTPLEWSGIALGVGAVLLLGTDRRAKGLDRREVVLAVIAGTAFAGFFIALSHTNADSGLWPIAAARAVSLPAAGVVLMARRSTTHPRARNAALVAGAGTFDMGANIALLLSLQRGSLAVNSVLSSLYPAVTALAAIAILNERPTSIQLVGIGAAMAAVAALTL